MELDQIDHYEIESLLYDQIEDILSIENNNCSETVEA